MFEKKFIRDAINRSAETEVDRRKLLTMAGVAGVGTAAAIATSASPAFAAGAPVHEANGALNDGSILNFALNLEYLEAEFYLHATTGTGLPADMIDGSTPAGTVTGGTKVPFKNKIVQAYAEEIANDEKAHVKFLRDNLAGAKVSRPDISLKGAFTSAARAAGLITASQTFDPYKNDLNFLLAAFLFEDVGVTAYKGAAPFIDNKTYLEAAAGILAVEAYHAGIIRTTLYGMGIDSSSVFTAVGKLSDARDSLDGSTDDDQALHPMGKANLVPTDASGIAYSRTPDAVLNIVYLNPASVTSGGFFPSGVNGTINTSGPTPAT